MMSASSHPPRPVLYQIMTLVGLLALVVLISAIFWQALDVFLVIFAGILLGIFLYSVSHTLAERLPLGYPWWLAIVTIAIFGGLGLLFYFLVPQVADRVGQLAQQLDEAVVQIRKQIQQTSWGRRLVEQIPSVEQLLSGQGGGSMLLPAVSKMLQTTFGAIVNGVVIFFIGLYAAATPHVYRHGILQLVPPERRDHAADVLGDLRATLWRWTLGRLFSMSVIGVATAFGLWLMGIPLPVTMGVIAALLTFIPNIGPVLSVIPPLLLGLQQSTAMGIYVLVFYLVLQIVESYLLTPLVQRHQVSLPPALTISVQLLMSVLAGALGLALATPLAAAGLVLVRDLYIGDVLHDRDRDGSGGDRD